MYNKEKNGYLYPFTSNKSTIPRAEIVVNKSTVELVKEHDPDAEFFRELEKQNIFLNEPQLNAVRSVNGPHLILAGAGSGKTRVLTSRTAYLLKIMKVPPEAIMLVSFTQKAAKEMIDRIALLPGYEFNPKGIVAGTFHSIFLKLLRSEGFKQRILSSNKQKEFILNQVLKEQNFKSIYEPEEILTKIDTYKSEMIQPQNINPTTAIEREIQEIYHEFEKKKDMLNLMDFSDVLLEAFFLLKYNESLKVQLQKRFQYICVDEFQDCNPIQKELVKMILNPNHQNLLAVGDEDQVIFEFQSASPKIIMNLKTEFPNLTLITLDTNYRSTDSIIGLGNSLIRHNKKRLGKVLKSNKSSKSRPLYLRPFNSDNEAKIIIENILSEVNAGKRKYKDFAVLYRTHSLSRAICDELILKGIPFKAHGANQSFYERAIIKPIIDYLRLSLDPNNIEAIIGIAQTLYLNSEKVEQYIDSKANSHKRELLGLLLGVPGLKPYHQEKILNRIEHIKKLKPLTPKEAIHYIRKGPIRYDDYIEIDEEKVLTLDKEWKSEILAELEAASDKFHSVKDFISFIDEIIPKQREMEDQENAVQLMTIHSSKGLEFSCVFIIGMVEGILPHKTIENANVQSDRRKLEYENNKLAALEEERRVAYVAITRAKEELYISSPKNYRGKNVDVSRFLVEAFATS